MIKFAAICPHPPLLIPGIGSNDDLKLVKKTLKSMDYLADDFEKAEIDTVILVTPHNMMFNDRMGVLDYIKYNGDFRQFGKSDIKMSFDADNNFIDELDIVCQKQDMPLLKFSTGQEVGQLDHGTMVPLYYLSKLTGNNFNLVIVSYSYLDANNHIKFGEIITKVCNNDKYKDKNIAIIASGDMSHRLFSGAPAGYADEGREFDKMIIKDLKNNDFNSITHYDGDFIEAAGECGYRSILILLGALDDKYKCNVLSYEGPFGVGYLVANFKLK